MSKIIDQDQIQNNDDILNMESNDNME